MPSWTVPTFSKIEVTFCATHPAMLETCQASGSAVASAPTPIRPSVQSHTPIAPVPTSKAALKIESVMPNCVMMRSCWRNASVCSSTEARTKASSSRGRANSFTVRMFV